MIADLQDDLKKMLIVGRSLLKENLLDFVVFSDCLVPSYCKHLIFNPACGFKVHSALETPEVHKWPATNLMLIILGQIHLQ